MAIERLPNRKPKPTLNLKFGGMDSPVTALCALVSSAG